MLNNLMCRKNKDKDKGDKQVEKEKDHNDKEASSEDANKKKADNNKDMKKVALITGGSSGIGAATAIELAKEGYRVAVTGRNKGRLEGVWRKLLDSTCEGKGDNEQHVRSDHFLMIQADFEDKSQVESIIHEVIQAFGRLDVLINNAGYSGRSRNIKDHDFFEDFQNIQQVNLHTPVRLCQLAATHLIETKGVIINVSSIADRVPFETISYSVSKAGLSMLTKCLANAFENKGVRVVGVAPGPVKTNFAPVPMDFGGFMTSIGRMGEARDVASFIAFLASPKASFIHGSIMDIDGGCYSKCNGVFKPPKLLRMFQ